MPWPIITEEDDLFDISSPDSILNKIRRSLHQRAAAVFNGWNVSIRAFNGTTREHIGYAKSEVWPLEELGNHNDASFTTVVRNGVFMSLDHISAVIEPGNYYLRDGKFYVTGPNGSLFRRSELPVLHNIHDIYDPTGWVHLFGRLPSGLGVLGTFQVKEGETPEDQYKYQGRSFRAKIYDDPDFRVPTEDPSWKPSTWTSVAVTQPSATGYNFRRESFSLDEVAYFSSIFKLGRPQVGDDALAYWDALLGTIREFAQLYFINKDSASKLLAGEIGSLESMYPEPIDYEVYLETQFLTGLDSLNHPFFTGKRVSVSNLNHAVFKKLENGIWARERFCTEPDAVYRSEIPVVASLRDLDKPILSLEYIQAHIDLLLKLTCVRSQPFREGGGQIFSTMFGGSPGDLLETRSYDDFTATYSDLFLIPESDIFRPAEHPGGFSVNTGLDPNQYHVGYGRYTMKRRFSVPSTVVSFKMFARCSTLSAVHSFLPNDQWVEISEDQMFHGRNDLTLIGSPPWSASIRTDGYIEFEFDDA